MAPPIKPGDNVPSSRPWIFTATYWNDVAKDVVKVTCSALTIYLLGTIGGIFKLHIEILVIVLVIAAFILLFALLEYLIRNRNLRPGWAFIIVGAAGGVVIQVIISLKWHLPGWSFILISFGFVLLVGGIGRWLGWRILPEAIRNSSSSTGANGKNVS